MKGLPAGGFVEGDSLLHKANGFLKFLTILVLLAAVILCDSLWGYGLMLAAIGLLILLSGLGAKQALSGILHFWLFFVLIFGMNALFYETASPIWHWWIFTLSPDGIYQGLQVVLRVAMAMVLGNVLVATTPPLELIGAIQCCIYPLRYIGVPIRDVAMILGVSIQFIPTFQEESDLIRKAQIARGARFESKNLFEKAASLLPLIVPVFLSAFRRADELSIAMEARGYRRSKNAPAFPKQHILPADILLLLTAALLCAAEIMV